MTMYFFKRLFLAQLFFNKNKSKTINTEISKIIINVLKESALHKTGSIKVSKIIIALKKQEPNRVILPLGSFCVEFLDSFCIGSLGSFCIGPHLLLLQLSLKLIFSIIQL